MSDEEYVSADEFFSSDEGIFSNNDFVMPEYSKEVRVNFVVPCFGDHAHVETQYIESLMLLPWLFIFLVLSHMNQIKLCLISIMQLSWKMVWKFLSNLCPMLIILFKLVG